MRTWISGEFPRIGIRLVFTRPRPLNRLITIAELYELAVAMVSAGLVVTVETEFPRLTEASEVRGLPEPLRALVRVVTMVPTGSGSCEASAPSGARIGD